MPDSESEDGAPFTTDCATSGTESGVGAVSSRKRQVSVHEMIRRSESRKGKRQAPCRGSRSPQDEPPPGAKRPAGQQAAPVELSAAALSSIQSMIDSGIAKVIATFEAKVEGFERRLTILESEAMDRACEVEQLKGQLAAQEGVLKELNERVESMDVNRRLSSLIFTCDDFATHSSNENIEDKLVEVIKRRYPDIEMSTADLQVAHRLQSDNKVIAKFTKRRLRDEIYDGRFNMVGGGGRPSQRAGGGRPAQQMAPLFITESLVPSRAALYQELLRARRPENGRLVASVFSRRGIVWCRTEKGGENIRVPDERHMRRILGGARFPPKAGAAMSAADRRGPPTSVGRAPSTQPQQQPGRSASSSNRRLDSDTSCVPASAGEQRMQRHSGSPSPASVARNALSSARPDRGDQTSRVDGGPQPSEVRPSAMASADVGGEDA